MRILVVEDDSKLLSSIDRGLSEEGYEVVQVECGDEAHLLLESESFDLIVLDLNLPGMDGLELLRALRARRDGVPVVVLTARDSIGERVEGLEAGADDYLVKPFAFAELLARVHVQLRRAPAAEGLRLRAGPLEIDRVSRRVTRSGRSIEVTPREFQVLELLMVHGGQPVSREVLAREVWGQEKRDSALDNLMEVLVGRLRRKIEVPGEPRLLATVRGVGYMIRAEA